MIWLLMALAVRKRSHGVTQRFEGPLKLGNELMQKLPLEHWLNWASCDARYAS